MASSRIGEEIQFSESHGPNVILQNGGKTAVWGMRQHCGSCFTNRSINKNETVKFKIQGSGHVYLGLLCFKPNPSLVRDKEVTAVDPNANWIHFRFRKEQTFISLSRNRSKEVTFETKSERAKDSRLYKIPEPTLYIFFQILFGDVIIDIEGEGVRESVVFDPTIGKNVNLQPKTGRRVCLLNPNPGSFCYAKRPLASGETFTISATPQDRANWTYAKVFVTNQDPQTMSIESLDPRKRRDLFPPEGIKIQKCGSLSLELDQDGRLTYTSEDKTCVLTLDRSPVYILLELFRVDVQISTMDEHVYTYITVPEDVTDELDGYTYPVEPLRLISSESHQTSPNIIEDQTYPKVTEDQTYSKVTEDASYIDHKDTAYLKLLNDDQEQTQNKCQTSTEHSKDFSDGKDRTHLNIVEETPLIHTKTIEHLSQFKSDKDRTNPKVTENTFQTRSKDSEYKPQFSNRKDQTDPKVIEDADLTHPKGAGYKQQFSNESDQTDPKVIEDADLTHPKGTGYKQQFSNESGQTDPKVIEDADLAFPNNTACGSQFDECREEAFLHIIPDILPSTSHNSRCRRAEEDCSSGAASGPIIRLQQCPGSPSESSLALVDEIKKLKSRMVAIERSGGIRPSPQVGTAEELAEFASKIRKNYLFLMETIEPDLIADHLLQNEMLTPLQHQTFTEMNHRAERCRFVLRLLQVKPTAKRVFISALDTPSERHILERLGY